MDNLIKKLLEGAIDDMVYRDKPKDKHIRRMEKDLGPLTGFPIEKFKNIPPPPNESGETESEIEKLDSILVDDEFVESADDVDKHFENYLDSKDLEYPREEIKKYMAGVRSIILQLKYHYNRPRPGQIAQAKGMKGFDPESLKSASTPSYPSGHATQGRFIGRLLGDIFPEHKEQLIKIGDDIAYSRNMAKVHYPSDSKLGKKLGDELYDYISKKNINEQYNPCSPYTSEAPPAQLYWCTSSGCQGQMQPVMDPYNCPQTASQLYQGPGVGPPLIGSWFNSMGACQNFCNQGLEDELVFDDEVDVNDDVVISNTTTLSHKPDELVFDDEEDGVDVNNETSYRCVNGECIDIGTIGGYETIEECEMECGDPCDDIPHYCCEKCEDPNLSQQDPCFPYCECCEEEQGIIKKPKKRVRETQDVEALVNNKLEPLANLGVKEAKNKYGIEVLEDTDYLYKKEKSMKKPIRIKESDIYRIVKKLIKEQGPDGGIPTGRKPGSVNPIARPDHNLKNKKDIQPYDKEEPRCFRIDAGGCLECPPSVCNNKTNPCPYPTMQACEEDNGFTGPLYTEAKRKKTRMKESMPFNKPGYKVKNKKFRR